MQCSSFSCRLFVFPVKLRGSVDEMERNASEETSEPCSERNKFVTVLSRGETYIQMCLLFLVLGEGGTSSLLSNLSPSKDSFLDAYKQAGSGSSHAPSTASRPLASSLLSQSLAVMLAACRKTRTKMLTGSKFIYVGTASL